MSLFQNLTLTKFVKNYRCCFGNRFSTSAILDGTPKKTLEEKLGIKPRPKRPSTAYFRFIAQMRPTVVQQNPQAKSTDVVTILSEHWKKADLDLKTKLQEEYKKDWEKYLEDCKVYDKFLSPGDRDEILKAKEEAKFQKQKRTIKKKREELGYPKKPGSSFMYFMKTKLPGRGDIPYREFQNKLKTDWEELPVPEKSRFEEMYKKDMEEYRTRLSEWTKQMAVKGTKDVVRGR